MKKDAMFPSVKVSESEFNEVRKITDVLDIPFSQLAREAIREKVAELKRTDPRLQQLEIEQAV